ncbi:hypothetical protein ACTHPH_21990 [Paenibacillus pasadenensis]|uniref:hypothetical protein n=1 Tax=Paenibacillus pasadenensis TaxID=217090 RepID=UPI00048BDF7E|nr:hypothetical protein [Paenibacillus pasadenensis]
MITKEEFMKLSKDDMIATYRSYKVEHKVSDIAKAFGFRASPNLYMFLRKLGIYENVVSQMKLPAGLIAGASPSMQPLPKPVERPPVPYGFSYGLNRDDLPGDELATALERIAAYLRLEEGCISIRLSVHHVEREVVEEPASDKEEVESSVG